MISKKTVIALKRVLSINHSGINTRAQNFAVVILPVFEKEKVPHILAILKADNKEYPWSNQVALPGGHVDKSDKSPLLAGLREIKEELGISPEHLDVMGSMGHFQTILDTDIEVFVAAWDGFERDLEFDKKEISKILKIPIPLLAARHVSADFSNRIPAIDELIYPFCGIDIWGVTARIFHAFLESLPPDFLQAMIKAA